MKKIEIGEGDVILCVDGQAVLEIGQVNDETTINWFFYCIDSALETPFIDEADIELLARRKEKKMKSIQVIKAAEVGEKIAALVFDLNQLEEVEHISIQELLETLDMAHGDLIRLVKAKRAYERFIKKLKKLQEK